MATFPLAPEELSCAWLTAALQGAGKLPEGRVAAQGWDVISEPGQTATVVRVFMELQDAPASAPRSAVLKLASPDPGTVGLMQTFGSYQREVRFYQELGNQPGIPVPEHYAAELDATGRFVLLLEDFGEARMGAAATEAGVRDVELALSHLAPFHARWWNEPRLPQLSWLIDPTRPGSVPVMRDAFNAVLAMVGERHGRYLDDHVQRMLKGWLEAYGPIGVFQASMGFTLTHGDFHPRQMFFPSLRDPRFAVFDWQTASVGVGLSDLARLIVQGLAPDVRRRHERRLFKLYCDKLGRQGVALPSTEQLWDQYRLGLVWSFWNNLMALAVTDLGIIQRATERLGLRWHQPMLEWPSQALLEHDVASLVAGFETGAIIAEAS